MDVESPHIITNMQPADSLGLRVFEGSQEAWRPIVEGILERTASFLTKKISWKAYCDRLAAQGRFLDAVDYLQDLAIHRSDAEMERQLVTLRGEAGMALIANHRQMTPPCVTADDVVADFPLSIPRNEISASSIRKGIASNGVVWVKGFFDREQTQQLQSVVHHSLKALEQATSEKKKRVEPWFDYYVPRITPASAARKDRFSNRLGSLRICDTPRGLSTWLNVAREAGLLRIVEGYLSGRPILTTFKTTFREAVPGPEHKVWHQDGAFMGPVRTLNTWVALTRCGRDAPGMEFVPQRMDILETGTEDAVFSWSVAPSFVDRKFSDNIVCPEFEPGDILLFDERLLHRTYIVPEMNTPRHAIESWFFHPSAYPEEFAVFAV